MWQWHSIARTIGCSGPFLYKDSTVTGGKMKETFISRQPTHPLNYCLLLSALYSPLPPAFLKLEHKDTLQPHWTNPFSDAAPRSDPLFSKSWSLSWQMAVGWNLLTGRETRLINLKMLCMHSLNEGLWETRHAGFRDINVLCCASLPFPHPPSLPYCKSSWRLTCLPQSVKVFQLYKYFLYSGEGCQDSPVPTCSFPPLEISPLTCVSTAVRGSWVTETYLG